MIEGLETGRVLDQAVQETANRILLGELNEIASISGISTDPGERARILSILNGIRLGTLSIYFLPKTPNGSLLDEKSNKLEVEIHCLPSIRLMTPEERLLFYSNMCHAAFLTLQEINRGKDHEKIKIRAKEQVAAAGKIRAAPKVTRGKVANWKQILNKYHFLNADGAKLFVSFKKSFPKWSEEAILNHVKVAITK